MKTGYEGDALAMHDLMAVICRHCGEPNGEHDNPFDGGKNLNRPECPGFEPHEEPSTDDLSLLLQRSLAKLAEKGMVDRFNNATESEIEMARRQRRV